VLRSLFLVIKTNSAAFEVVFFSAVPRRRPSAAAIALQLSFFSRLLLLLLLLLLPPLSLSLSFIPSLQEQSALECETDGREKRRKEKGKSSNGHKRFFRKFPPRPRSQDARFGCLRGSGHSASPADWVSHFILRYPLEEPSPVNATLPFIRIMNGTVRKPLKVSFVRHGYY